MKERRNARVGTVSGLALLTGATALVAVAGGPRSIFATLLLGLLAAGMAHALVVEIQRQARRRVRSWGRHDSVNAVLLACWSLLSTGTLVPAESRLVQLLGAVLAVGYAAACAYFVVERRRAVSAPVLPAPSPAVEPAAPSVTDSTPST